MLVDLHAKSSATTGVQANVATVLQRAKDAGIDAVAFCETLATAHCNETLAAAHDAGVTAFIGVEIPTDKGLLLCFVPQIDDFYLQEEWRQLTELVTPPASEVIELVRSHGGAVIAARPYDMSIAYNMGDQIFTLGEIDAVEVFNTRCTQVQNDFAVEAAKFLGTPTCGGSDPTSASNVGRYATFFREEFSTQQDFVTALREAEYWAVQFGESPKQSTSNNRSEDRNDRGRGRGRRDDKGRGRSGSGRGRSGSGRGRSGSGRGRS